MKTLSHKNKTDQELVALSLENPDYYQYLMERYEKKLFRYIRRITNVETETVEDLLQEVFLKAYKNLHGYDDSLPFSSWIYRIAHNETISNYRKTKTQPTAVEMDEEGAVDILNTIPDDINLRDDYIKREMARKVREVINLLPEKYRTVLILKFLEDKSYEEMADILQKPAGTIATLINRSKQQFKKLAVKHHLNKP